MVSSPRTGTALLRADWSKVPRRELRVPHRWLYLRGLHTCARTLRPRKKTDAAFGPEQSATAS